MLKVKSLIQPSVAGSKQRSTLCGPTCLRMVLAYYGVKKTERALMNVVNYDPHVTDNKGAARLAEAAKKLGFQGKVKDCATVKDIRYSVLQKKVPVIVNWFSTDEGHYSVVVHIDKKHITLRDPETGRLRKMSLAVFESVWFDFSPHDLRTPKALVTRRMIVITQPSLI